ncbi:MAG: flagellin [Gammaproteobacteria bacterium]
MPQVINTNLGSIVAQANLDRTNDSLSDALAKLSSGLRINSAKDDAAGIAISARFVSKIQGSGQAQRNANDAISVAQLAEGALGESTKILQRIRTLAVQSANGSNSAIDRQALQTEVNQLKQEITRVGNSIDFNGVKLLDGTFLSKSFQIGTEQFQTVDVSIADSRATALGANQVRTNNSKGIEQAVGDLAFVGSAGATGQLGSSIGSRTTTASNGYASTQFTFTYQNASGSNATVTASIVSNGTAKAFATAVNTALSGSGISADGFATGFNAIRISGISAVSTSSSFSLGISGTAINIGSGTGVTLQSIATAINANTNAQAAGVYAVYSSSGVDIYSPTGEDIYIHNASTDGTNITSRSLIGAATTTGVQASGSTNTFGGRLDLFLTQGFTVADSGSVYFHANFLDSTNAAYGGRNVAVKASDLTNTGTLVRAQTLTVTGGSGTGTVAVTKNQSAESIAASVNAIAGTTGVTAIARTTVRLQNLKVFSDALGLTEDTASAAGTINFSLVGENSTPVTINAGITNNGDLSPLLQAINAQSGATGISAAVGTSTGILELTHQSGKNIKISDLEIGYAVDYRAVSTSNTVSGDGQTVNAAKLAYIEVVGNPVPSDGISGNSGTTIRLYDGGVFSNNNSTVVGGELTFSSTNTFSVSSDVSGNTNTGYSLFNAAASIGTGSSLAQVNDIDIGTEAGAQKAIVVADKAIDIINKNRADLGAVQNRFQSAVRSLSSSITNLTSSNSRVLDADFAAETANLTRAQILNQAGIAILSQANQIPQQILSLLR